jgi:F-type Type IV secretion system, TraN
MDDMEKTRLLRPLLKTALVTLLVLTVTFPVSIFNEETMGANRAVRRDFRLSGLLILTGPLSTAEADSIQDAAKQGADTGKTLSATEAGSLGTLTPASPVPSCSSQGTGACVPQFDSAQQSTYQNYYSNPAGLQQTPTNDATSIADYCNDPGNANSAICQERNDPGIAATNASSKDILENAYSDCVKTSTSSSNSIQYKTCTGTDILTSVPCTIRTMLTTDEETINTPCNHTTIPYKADQIYAVCRDYYDYYEVPQTSEIYGDEGLSCGCSVNSVGGTTCECSDDCTCGSYSHSFCRSDINYLPSTTPAAGCQQGVSSSYCYWLGTNFVFTKCKSHWYWGHDHGTSDRYDIYLKYRYSKIDRIYAAGDSTCGKKLPDPDCGISHLDICDLSGQNCVTVIDNRVETGAVPSNTCSVVNQQLESDTICSMPDYTFDITYPSGISSGYSGTLSNHSITPGSVTVTAGTSVLTDNSAGVLLGGGTGTIDYNSGFVTVSFSNPPPAGNPITVNYSYRGTASDIIGWGDNTTSTFTGTLSHIPVLPSTVGVTDSPGCQDSTCALVDNGSGSGSLLGIPGNGTIDYSTGYVSANFTLPPPTGNSITAGYQFSGSGSDSLGVTGTSDQTTTAPITKTEVVVTQNDPYSNVVTWNRAIGGPDTPVGNALFYANVVFQCNSGSDDCDALKQQGCTLYSQRYTDPDQTQVEYTYACGDNSPTGGSDQYSCNGQVRCMGTDCIDGSYSPNQDFVQADAGLEVMEELRKDYDPTTQHVFEGKASSCQNSPKNCCKPNTGGLSILDYVSSAKALYAAYTYFAQGYSGIVMSYASSIASIAGGGGMAPVADLVSSGQTLLSGSLEFTEPGMASFTGLPSITADPAIAGEVAGDTTIGGNTVSVSGFGANTTLSAVANVAAIVGICYTVYTIVNMVFNLLFGCKTEDMVTSSKLGFGLCSQIGTCDKGLFDLSHNRVYCCYNSMLARIVNEQGRAQLGLPWTSDFSNGRDCGTSLSLAQQNYCDGFTPGELSQLDFSKIDLSEYMKYIEQMVPIPQNSGALQTAFQNRFNSLTNTSPQSPSPCTGSTASVQPYTVSETLSASSATNPQEIKEILISDNCGAPLTYTAATDSAWMTFPSSGTGSGSLTFSPAGLQPGNYSGSLIITPAGYPAVTVPVYLTVTQ